MPWKDMKTFIDNKVAEYTAELKDSTTLQMSQKKFNESYTSKAKLRELEMTALLDKDKKTTAGASGTSSTGASGSYSGSNQEQFWQFFIADGYTKEAVAGMMGNVAQESSFETGAVEGNGEGNGIVQWSFTRKTDLKNYAASEGKEWTDIQVQLRFLKKELDGYYLSVMPGFKTYTSIYDAVETFCWKFEVPAPATADMANRHSKADQYYAEFKDKDFSAAGTSVTGNAAVQAVIAEAKKYLGLAYSQANRYGPDSYDCSSYLQMVFRNVIGRDIGINTWEQEKQAGTLIPVEQRRAGDLLLFGVPGDPYHVALSLGGDAIYHAANPEQGILEAKLWPVDLWPYTAIRVPELE